MLGSNLLGAAGETADNDTCSNRQDTEVVLVNLDKLKTGVKLGRVRTKHGN